MPMTIRNSSTRFRYANEKVQRPLCVSQAARSRFDGCDALDQQAVHKIERGIDHEADHELKLRK